MTTTAPALAPATYRIDPARSSVRFTAKELFGLIKVPGAFPVTGGTVVVAEDLTLSRVSATMDAASIDTGSRRRDNDLRTKRFLDTARHPEITFSSREVRAGTVTGVLTVRGTGQWVTLDVTAIPAGDGYRFVATTRIDRRAFGVTAGRGLISPEIDVAIEVYASRT
jgi:polyisoprenoid-binding protein YceI